MYKEIFDEVKNYLESHCGDDDDRGFTFRKRSDHIWRVFVWAKRLSEDCAENINKDALFIAALFHDVGRYISHDDHPNQSALIFHDYAENKSYDKNQAEFIEYLIRNHANKEMLFSPDIPLELVFLLEADMLDETGALGIIWDAMMTGGRSAKNYMETYDLLLAHSCDYDVLGVNPMRTAKAKIIWENKQKLIMEFLNQLKDDLGVDENPLWRN